MPPIPFSKNNGIGGMISENLFLREYFLLKENLQICVVGTQVVTTSANEFHECGFSSIFLNFFNHVRIAYGSSITKQ